MLPPNMPNTGLFLLFSVHMQLKTALVFTIIVNKEMFIILMIITHNCHVHRTSSNMMDLFFYINPFDASINTQNKSLYR